MYWLTMWGAAYAQPEPARIMAIGEVAGRPFVVTSAPGSKKLPERFQVHWHGPQGRVTSTLVPAEAFWDYERILQVTVDGDTLRYVLDGGYTSTGNAYERYEARFQPESGWFVPAPGWRTRSEVQTRLRQGD